MKAKPDKKIVLGSYGRRRSRRVTRQVIRRVVLGGIFLILGVLLGLVVVFNRLSAELPQIGPLLEGYEPPQTTRFVTADGTVLGELFIERRQVVPIAEIPQVMLDAVIAAEDADFREHEGLDYPGMIRAMLTNVTTGRLAQGASTITQQVARTFFLSREKTFSRKVREILLTKRIEDRLTKDEILYLYLNQINFGHGRYGVQEAAQFYFAKDIGEIGLSQAALLAGIPKGPSIYAPDVHPDAARERRAYVLGEMAGQKMISAAAARSAKEAPLGVVPRGDMDVYLAPEAVNRAIAELRDLVDPQSLRRGGYIIETTLDPRLQKKARAAVRKGLGRLDKRHKLVGPFKRPKRWPRGDRGLSGNLRRGRLYLAEVIGHDDAQGLLELKVGRRRGWARISSAGRANPENLAPSRFALEGAVLHVSLARETAKGKPLELRLELVPQAALVALEPQTGRILALVGGDVVEPRGFDRATGARRQPGSAFKPLVYLTAIRSRRFTPATLIDDAPVVNEDWQPQNVSGDYAGTISLRQALTHSRNLPAIRLLEDLGPALVVDTAQRLGISSPLDPSPSLALGTSEVSPLELAGAFAAIANQGLKNPPHLVSRVIDPHGQELPLTGRMAEQVILAEEAYLVTSLLCSVVEEGTGRGAREMGRAVAGKTGTTNEERDAWFVGYTPQIACAVWVGYDLPRSLGRKETGSRAALPIWLDFMRQSHRGLPQEEFAVPAGIVTVAIDPASGLLAYEGMEGSMEELFIEGTEPSETAVPPELVSLDDFLIEQAEAEADAGPSPPRDGGP